MGSPAPSTSCGRREGQSEGQSRCVRGEGAGTVAHWLMKTEPGDFSWDDLVRVGREPWNGVRNWAALHHMGEMRPGELALFYHTGNERRVVGVCRIVSEPYPEPGQNNPRVVAVDIAPAYRLDHPVTLAEIRADPAFAGWELVRQSRLSVMPVPDALWSRIQGLALAGAG